MRTVSRRRSTTRSWSSIVLATTMEAVERGRARPAGRRRVAGGFARGSAAAGRPQCRSQESRRRMAIIARRRWFRRTGRRAARAAENPRLAPAGLAAVVMACRVCGPRRSGCPEVPASPFAVSRWRRPRRGSGTRSPPGAAGCVSSQSADEQNRSGAPSLANHQMRRCRKRQRSSARGCCRTRWAGRGAGRMRRAPPGRWRHRPEAA